jgi:uncharacterized protein HemX
VSRYRFIAVEKAHHSVVLLCRVLGVAKSAFYAWQRQNVSARAQADEQLTEEIKRSTTPAAARTVRHACMRSCATVASGLGVN